MTWRLGTHFRSYFSGIISLFQDTLQRNVYTMGLGSINPSLGWDDGFLQTPRHATKGYDFRDIHWKARKPRQGDFSSTTADSENSCRTISTRPTRSNTSSCVISRASREFGPGYRPSIGSYNQRRVNVAAKGTHLVEAGIMSVTQMRMAFFLACHATYVQSIRLYFGCRMKIFG